MSFKKISILDYFRSDTVPHFVAVHFVRGAFMEELILLEAKPFPTEEDAWKWVALNVSLAEQPEWFFYKQSSNGPIRKGVS